MATISFWAGQGGENLIQHLQGSGLVFFGASAGDSVLVGEYNQVTYIGNSNGTAWTAPVDNIRYGNHLASGFVNNNGNFALTGIPNALATLKVRFDHTAAVQVQNARARIYDRTNVGSGAVGVTCLVAELRNHASGHFPLPNYAGSVTASANSIWRTASTTGWQNYVLNLAQSPGYSGIDASNLASSNASMVHEWYLAITASPESIGSKTQFGLYIQLEYL